MPKRNRKGIDYPRNFMKRLKKAKKKKLRNLPIEEKITEQLFNNSEIII